MIDQMAKNLFNELSSILPRNTSDLPEKEARALLEATLRKMNLVTRDEFDAQQAVLLRTRAKVEQLEHDLAQLEQQLSSRP